VVPLSSSLGSLNGAVKVAQTGCLVKRIEERNRGKEKRKRKKKKKKRRGLCFALSTPFSVGL